ncbi:PREDICTED: uncharacterized protein LOC104772673 [Camelina sativa]|uniref:Uncharacterized protein LOC104772673 n=1 Tax=Camelina sativa TaxID=90675 RepID=A0ABM0Y4X7_CAMSA|nr:PREDICTED: uncharacterized protein LOC104772673 [Camelina sativa]
MSDTTVAVVKTKERGGFSCPMLNLTNYTVWAMRMRITLRVNKVWEVIETDQIDDEKNNLAMALLFQSIPESLILQVGELDTAKKVWEAIQAWHVGAERVREARLQTLMSEFDRLKMKDSDKIDDFVGKISEISSKSAALGVNIKESKVIKKFLKNIVGRMKAYEERISEEEDVSEDQGKLMYANMETQSNRDYNDNFRYRGRGGRSYYTGRGRGRTNGGRDTSKITCFRCDKIGHYASSCPDRLLKLQKIQELDNKETQDTDELMIHEVVFLNEKLCNLSQMDTNAREDNIWYLDNGASNHMTRDRRYFDSIDNSVIGKVRFGDDSRIDIKGKGPISFIDINGEPRKMMDVYFIPDLKSNIISLGQATEAGCDVRMLGECLTMHDRNRKLLVKADRSKNRLYKVRMGVENTTCLLSSTVSESSRWHASLGHLNAENLKNMMQRDLTFGLPRFVLDTEVCSSCLLGKQTRRSFPCAISYRAANALELIHGDLCIDQDRVS